MQAHAQTRQTIVRLLSSMGSAKEISQYLKRFSQAGYTSFVFGPGDIAQAHSADEWVALEQLAAYAAHVQRIIERGLA